MRKIFAIIFLSLTILLACSQASIESLSGKYQREGSQELLEFNTDGSCILHQDGKEYRGNVVKTDKGLELQLGINLSLKLNVKDGVLLGDNGARWLKQ